MTEQKQKSTAMETTGWGCAVLFALPFATIGTVAFGAILLTMYYDVRMQFWQVVPCAILATEFSEAHDEGTTYQTTAKFRYEFDNKTYESTWVGLTLGKDNIGDFHERVYRELKQHQDTGQAFRCFVNPWWPSEAILYREARWEMIAFITMFAIMFGGVGWGMLAMIAIAWKNQRKHLALRHDASLTLWQRREDWKNNELRYSEKRIGQNILWCAVGVLVMSVAALFTSSRELVRNQNPFALLGIIPTGFGLLLLYSGYRYLRRWQQFGDSVLQLSTLPGEIGGSLIGTVQVERRVKSPDGFLVCIVCTETSGTGDSQTMKVLWDDERTIIRDMNPEMLNSTGIPILFDIPNDCLETKGEHAIFEQPNLSNKGEDKIVVQWKLTVTSLSKGVNYKAEFEVPVFRTGESLRGRRTDESLIAKYETPDPVGTVLERAGIGLDTSDPKCTRIYFPRGRAKAWLYFTAFIYASVFSGFLIPVFMLFPAYAYYVVALSVILWLASVGHFYFFQSALEITSQNLSLQTGRFNLGPPQNIPADDIEKIDFRIHVQQQATKAGQPVVSILFDVYLKRYSERRTTLLANHISSRKAAEYVVMLIEEKLNRQASQK